MFFFMGFLSYLYEVSWNVDVRRGKKHTAVFHTDITNVIAAKNEKKENRKFGLVIDINYSLAD